ncbi:NuoM family protein [Anaeromyxobacter sp. Fw109-5]|uniref:complex I subunit 4 family protein n=1 Tax=Anaeromyxobacter sp. (strain Fw109-5) TaxID=404589 RepID=UPI0000ED8120|nr:NADH-quinone oxidoreductase subunit M [Anaeromyxobacter sp. Fw109-5]ABS25488.1 proton-translocating NADH-quinone oxidoreductase, chain M [Anaeromyxobacter sp. Fw109-5]
MFLNPGNVLSWATFFPLLGAAAIVVLLAVRFVANLPKKLVDDGARLIALLTSGLSFVAAIAAWRMYDPTDTGVQLAQHFVWIRAFNIEYYVGVDGLSISMVLLSGLISFVATIASMPWWSGAKAAEMAGMVDDDHGHGHDDAHHPKHFSVRMVPGYMVMLLLLQTGMMGTFVSLDMFLFYVFWEVMLLPMYFLIGVWGGPRKEYAAIKFFLYTLAGSVLMLLAIIGIYYNSLPAMLADGTMSSGHTFNLIELGKQGAQGQFLNAAPILGMQFTKLAFVALFIGFAIKIPMFPFHTWLPDAHVEAPTPISVILAGVLLKMGIYGILRFNYPLLPDATAWAANAMAVFGVINIVYAAFVCLGQKDLKKLIAYSSVSHMGFSLLGMAAMTPAGISGAVLNLFTHGIISPMLFLIVGVIYDRAHHREIEKFGGLAAELPEYTAIMGLAFFASLGLPGLAGFIAEFMVFTGAFPVFTTYTIISATAVIITAAYYLWAIHRMFLGKLNPVYKGYPDLNWRERISLYPLAAIAIVLGFYPQAILGVINRSLHLLIQNIRPL